MGAEFDPQNRPLNSLPCHLLRRATEADPSSIVLSRLLNCTRSILPAQPDELDALTGYRTSPGTSRLARTQQACQCKAPAHDRELHQLS